MLASARFVGLDYAFTYILFMFIVREIAKLSAHRRNGVKLLDTGEGRVWAVMAVLPFIFVPIFGWFYGIPRAYQDIIFLASIVTSLVAFIKLMTGKGETWTEDDDSYSPAFIYTIYGLGILFLIVAFAGNIYWQGK